MKAVTVVPDPELDAYASNADWRHGVGVTATPLVDARAWARANFEGAPVPMRVFLVIGWVLLLLEGRPRSDAQHVLGWPVVLESPETVVLQRRSRHGINATLVFTARDGAGMFSSAMTYTSRFGRAVWFFVAPVHRWAARFVVTDAAKRVAKPDVEGGTT